MTNQRKLTERRYVVPFVLITTLFFLWGFARAILDVLNKHFQDELHISITQSSLIQVTTYLGYFLMAIPAGLFIRRYGYRYGVVFGLTLFGLGALAFIPSNTFTAFLGALFVGELVFFLLFKLMPRKAVLFLSQRSPTAPIRRRTRQSRKASSSQQGFSLESSSGSRYLSARS